MLKLRFLLIPLGAVATIAALSQTVSHATTREQVVPLNMTEQVVTCTDENRKVVDICIIADSVSR